MTTKARGDDDEPAVQAAPAKARRRQDDDETSVRGLPPWLSSTLGQTARVVEVEVLTSTPDKESGQFDQWSNAQNQAAGRRGGSPDQHSG